jgi:7-cyano-7-deazaguanine synthase
MMMCIKSKAAVVLLSGGIDSTTTMAIVKAEGFEVSAITFNYGQRHHIELNAARLCAKHFNVKRHLIVNFNLREIGGSALTSDEIEVPKDRIQSIEHKTQILNNENLGSEIPVTYVPARNTIFLSFALSFAESIGAEDIFIGANAVDYSGYPDCRPEFISAFEQMANLATKASIEQGKRFKIRAPLINFTKAEIIKKGLELGVDFSLTWSCYDPQERKKEEGRRERDEGERKISSFTYIPCMHCDSCILRAKGFKEAGIEDPLMLKSR